MKSTARPPKAIMASSMTLPAVAKSGLLACILLAPGLSRAATLVYLSADGAGQSAAPVSPQETLEFLPAGGSFHIWVEPDALLTGISLDVDKSGSAIRFTGSTIYNPSVGADTRWLPGLIRDGSVTDAEVSRIEGGALAPLVGFGTGIGPTTSSSDPFYESTGGFLFATIDFTVIDPDETSTASLSIGHNLMSDSSGLASESIYLGPSDGPVTNSVGATGTVVDLNFVARALHPSDFDTDGDVDGIDFLIWQLGFGITSGATRSQGDADDDGKVDSTDLGLWQTQFGTVPTPAIASSVAVPEATTLYLAIAGLSVLLATLGRCRSQRCSRHRC
ncbi:hypothetical protein HG15A2_27650 [Adhaeretor mobilis]|uniref:PEP-CTERM protein-sorting domain-containing protein n=2 Tax=Adhaeretor mobilis TaxID=1930276 RepID=A0A517MX34_9BACT|nr:hypothetical protein HG15A2_27650 [Adhaeretor mobilis]